MYGFTKLIISSPQSLIASHMVAAIEKGDLLLCWTITDTTRLRPHINTLQNNVR